MSAQATTTPMTTSPKIPRGERHLMEDERVLGPMLLAPALIYIEVANALWSAVRRQRLLPEEAADALDLITRAPLRQGAEDASLAQRALQLSLLLDHPVYDCSYLALAMRHKVPVVTADRRFVRAAAAVPEAAPFVRLLGDPAAH